MIAFIALALLAVLGPEREPSPPVTGPIADGPFFQTLIPRAGGFSIVSHNPREQTSLVIPRDLIARLDDNLAALDPTGIALPLPVDTGQIAAVHDAAGIDLLFENSTAIDAIGMYYARTNDSGTLLVAPIQLSSWSTGDSPFSESLQITQDGARTICSWLEHNNLGGYALKVATITNGVVSGPWTVDATGAAQNATLASSGGDTLLFWNHILGTPANQFLFVRMSNGAAPGAPATLMSGNNLYQPAIAPIGNKAFYLVWSTENASSSVATLNGAPISSGNVLGTTVTIDSGQLYQYAAQVASAGTDLRVLFNGYSSSSLMARTVPFSGAPASSAQAVGTLASNSGSTPALACSGSTCAVAWLRALGTNAYETVLTGLDAHAAPLDVPPLEYYFPADAQGPPLFVADGALEHLLFSRTLSRDASHLLDRRLSSAGGFLDTAPIDLGPVANFTAAASPGGGVLVATLGVPDDLGEADLAGHLLASSGLAADAGLWGTSAEAPYVYLACAKTRCGLVYLSGNEWNAVALSPAGQVLASTKQVSALNALAGFTAAAGKFLYVLDDDGYITAASGDEASFPAYGAQVAIGAAQDDWPSNRDVQFAAQGSKVAMIWSRDQQCTIEGRVYDLDAGSAPGATLVAHRCTDDMGEQDHALGLEAIDGGYRLLYSEVGFQTLSDGGYVPMTKTFTRDTDLAMSDAGAEVLLDARSDPLLGMSIARLKSGDIFTYARFDSTEGIGAQRAKVVGLDGGDGDGGVADAGTGPADAGSDAGPADAGAADAGTSDAGVDAGPIDAGAPDAGSADAGEHDAGTVDAGHDAGVSDAGTADAGSDEPTSSGCGCSSTSSQSGSIAPIALLALGMALLRRRKAVPGSAERRVRQ